MASDLLQRHLVRPVEDLLAKVKDLPSLLKRASLTSLDGAASAFDSLKGAADSAGINLKELPTPSRGG